MRKKTPGLAAGEEVRLRHRAVLSPASFFDLPVMTFRLWRSPGAPPVGIRQHEQVEAGQHEQYQGEQSQDTHAKDELLRRRGDEIEDDVDDDQNRENDGQPKMRLPNQFTPIHGILPSINKELYSSYWTCSMRLRRTSPLSLRHALWTG